MALGSCLTTQEVQFDADDLSRRNSTRLSTQEPNSSQAYDRCAVRLNVPTVANLRRQSSVTTSRKSWTRHAQNTMPVTSRQPSLALPSNTNSTVLVGEGNNARLKEPPMLSGSRPPSRSHQTSAQKGAQTAISSSGSRRGSLKSESAESSPTTTISTLDSTLTEPSPSSSPESPTGLVPLTSLSSLNKNSHPSESQGMDRRLPGLHAPPLLGFEQLESPNKKGRNVKSLSINTNGISTTRPATAPGPSKVPGSDSNIGSVPPLPPASAMPGVNQHMATKHAVSEPVSPSFIMPNVPKPRRSKMNLTITTSDSSGSSGGIPATPAFAPLPKTPGFGIGFSNLSSMREHEEPLFSPSGAPVGGMQLPPFGRANEPILPTPSKGPDGGMTLPPFGSHTESSPQRPPSRPALSIGSKSFEGPPGSSVINQTIEHRSQVPLHDLPLSKEVKSPSYPDGPACIYPPNVFLYHQPTAEEAREFDVIVNVAREVTNPFELEKQEADERKAAKGYVDSAVQCELLTGPPLSLAFEKAPRGSASAGSTHDDEPDTPKAVTPRSPNKMPEYIHLPWEHNSNVYKEWLGICELIDQRASEGKKVLVHCQLGVSRSASLIVAYGLYKNPSLSPDEAREQAKEKSRWIDLNMHFMYELGDFKKILAEKFGDHYAVRRPAGPASLSRAKTEFLGPTYQDDDIHSRRASSGPHTNLPEAIEEEKVQVPLSAFPGTSTLPFGLDGTSLPPIPSRAPADLPIRTSTSSPAKAESGSSNATTPVQEEAASERLVPKRTKTNDSDRTLKGTASRTSPESKPPPPVPSGIFSPTSTSFNTNSFSAFDITPAKAIQPLHAITNDSPQIPDPTPPRRLRPVPSLPAGFNCLRRVSHGLTLNTNTTSPSLDALKSSRPIDVDNTQTNEQAGDAPQLPSLDFGSSLLMSPRTTEFALNPFHRSRNSLAGDLAGIDFLMSPGAQDRDPRSPPIRGETTITRSIDDVL